MFDVETLENGVYEIQETENTLFSLEIIEGPEIEKQLLQEGLVFVKHGHSINWMTAGEECTCVCKKSKVTDKIKRIVKDQ